MRTQVCIIGGGPSGLLLSQMLHLAGIDTVVLEARSRDHVLARIRAGVLEWGSVETLREAGVGARMDRDGLPHDGIYLAAQNRGFRIDFLASTGRRVMVYGQTEVTHDLYDAREAAGGIVIHEVQEVAPELEAPAVTFCKDGTTHRVACDWIAGCDGSHGISRTCLPESRRRSYDRVYPFGWLGILSETPPVDDELIYANHARGFALCSMRNRGLSRYYIQCGADERPEAWSDEAFWDELRRRIPGEAAERCVTGPSIEKSVAPLRSSVTEPMRWGPLFLVGDAAHIVPPTGAKGLNLAIGDARLLARALVAHYGGDDEGIEHYSERALARVWQAVRFSWSFTTLMHRFPDQSDFDQKIQEAGLARLAGSAASRRDFAEQYVGALT